MGLRTQGLYCVSTQGTFLIWIISFSSENVEPMVVGLNSHVSASIYIMQCAALPPYHISLFRK